MEYYKKEYNNLSMEVLVDGETLFTRVDEYISIIPWKINLLACSKTKPYLFLAVNNNIYGYKIYTENKYSEEPFIILKTGNSLEISINTIKMGFLYDEEILVAVCDNGVIAIYFMSDIQHEPIKLINDDNISTWGAAIFGPLGYIAVSANNFLIKMYKILKADDIEKSETEDKNNFLINQNEKEIHEIQLQNENNNNNTSNNIENENNINNINENNDSHVNNTNNDNTSNNNNDNVNSCNNSNNNINGNNNNNNNDDIGNNGNNDNNDNDNDNNNCEIGNENENTNNENINNGSNNDSNSSNDSEMEEINNENIGVDNNNDNNSNVDADNNNNNDTNDINSTNDTNDIDTNSTNEINTNDTNDTNEINNTNIDDSNSENINNENENNNDNNSTNENNQEDINDSEMEELDFESNYIDKKNSVKIIENNSKYVLGKECMYFKGHKHNIPYISFSKDGKYLISSSIDSTIKIWNVNSGKNIYSKTIEKKGWNWTGSFIEIHHGYIYEEDVIEKYLSNIHANDYIMDRFMALRRFFPNISSNLRNILNRGEMFLNSVTINDLNIIINQNQNVEGQDNDDDNSEENEMDEGINVIDSGSEISFREDIENDSDYENDIIRNIESSNESSNENEYQKLNPNENDSTSRNEFPESNISSHQSPEKINKKRSYNSMRYDKDDKKNAEKMKKKSNFTYIESYDLMGNQKLKKEDSSYSSNSENLNSIKKEEDSSYNSSNDDQESSSDGIKGKKKKSEEGPSTNSTLHNFNIVNNPEYHEVNYIASHPNMNNETHLLEEIEIEEDSFNNNNNTINNHNDDENINIDDNNINENNDNNDDSHDHENNNNDNIIESNNENDHSDTNNNNNDIDNINNNDDDDDDDDDFDDVVTANDNLSSHSYSENNDNIPDEIYNIEFGTAEDSNNNGEDDDNPYISVRSFTSEDNDEDFFSADEDRMEIIPYEDNYYSDDFDDNNGTSDEGTDETDEEENSRLEEYNGDVLSLLEDIDDSDEDYPVVDHYNNADDDDNEDDEENKFSTDSDIENELNINVNNNTYLLVSTISDIYLIDKSGKVIDVLVNPFEPYCKSLNRYSRISIMEWIPNIEVAVVANQKGIFGLLRIIKLKDNSKMKLVLETYLPEKSPLYPLAGLCVKSYHSNVDPLLSYHLIYVAFLNGSFYVYKLRHNLNSFPLSLIQV